MLTPRAERTRDAARKKLLGILPRPVLEEMSQMERPWHADRATLLTYAVANWNPAEAEEAIMGLLKKAK